MISVRLATAWAVLVLLAASVGCGRAVKPNYSAYFAHEPRSILVVPAMNETTAVDAHSVYMTTVSRPLAERGFYVFPVQLTDALLEDLGLPEAGLVHQVPPERFYETFGADAVLFVTIQDWSNKYVVLQASTVVTIHLLLKDTRSGAVLWETSQSAIRSSGSSGNLIVMAVAAAVTYAINQMIDVDYRPLALQANSQAFFHPQKGLPAGPYHPDYGKDRANFGP